MGSEDFTLTPEKPSKSSSTSATPTKHSTHSDAGSPSVSKKINNNNNNVLYKHQGQKWQHVFDFDKILKHLRGAEKQLRHKKCEYFGTNNACQGCNPDTGNGAAIKSDSPPRAVKQVQRLNAKDMHYYGIVGNRPMIDIVVCNVCGGSYTKMGFNNHMMLQHPSVWSTISTKVDISDGGTDSVRILPITEMAAAAAAAANAEAGPSSSGTAANANETANATSSTNSRHKSKKGSSKSGSSSSSTGRSRSKSKHHSSSHTSSSSKHSTPVETKPVVETPSSSTSSSSSKKSTKSNKKGAATAAATTTTTTPAANAMPSSAKDSKANSDSSASTTPASTPKKNAASTLEALVTASTPTEKAYSPNNVKDKLLMDKVSQAASKKKSKGSSHSAQESHDLAIAQTVSLFERPTSTASTKSQKSANSSTASKSSTSSSSSSSAKTSSSSKKSKSDQKRTNTTEVTAQLSELDRAVSSITGVQEMKKELHTQLDDVKPSTSNSKSNKSVAVGAYRKPPLLVDVKKEKPSLIKSESTANYDTLNTAGMAQQSSSPLNNTILTFDDMLDNKFISEILGNADTEISYNEHVATNDNSSGSVQPGYSSQNQPPATKRMRYDVHETSIMQQPMELSNDFAMFQPDQQQQQQQQQQYANYNTTGGVLEDIKIFNSPQAAGPMEGQYQTQNQEQMDTLETSQLQQLLYQQQNLNVYNENAIRVAGNETNLQQTSYDETNYCPDGNLDNKPKIMDMCSSENDVKLEDYTALATINNTYANSRHGPAVDSEFQLYNVPSITDDTLPVAQSQDIIVDNMRQQYVLPQGTDNEQPLIYEITGNNQVSVLSQVRQQQVITELLNQAGYENVEYMNVAAPAPAATTPAGLDESSEWFDFDFSRIETAKTIMAPINSGTASQLKPVRSEFTNLTPLKFHEDFYMNVHVYTHIPRPLAINTFGLVKLPWSVAGTFRKHIISSRKANNSPITLSSCMGGTNGLGVRVPKSSHNYFTALSAAGQAATGSANNEFSIGSITITNSPSSGGAPAQHPYRHSNQTNGHIEISFNTNSNSSVISPPTTTTTTNAAMHSKMRPRITGMLQSPGSSVGGSAMCGASTSIGALRFSPHSTPVKTVYVPNGATVIKNSDSIVKRCVIANHSNEVDEAMKPTHFTAQQISDFLASGNRIFESIKQEQPTPDNSSHYEPKCSIAHTKKMLRMNNFYQQRKKLASVMSSPPMPHQHQQQQLQRQKQQQQQQQTSKQTILKQRLLKNQNDCGPINTQCKMNANIASPTTANSSTSNNGELMRVFM